MSETLEYSDIIEICELYNENDVNKFLSNDWTLIKILQNNPNGLHNAMYVLGRTSNVISCDKLFDKLKRESSNNWID